MLASFVFNEDIGKTELPESSDLSMSIDSTKFVRSISSLGDISITCILDKSFLTDVLVYESNSVLFSFVVCVTVILETVVDIDSDPASFSLGVVAHLSVVHEEPFQYKTIRPLASGFIVVVLGRVLLTTVIGDTEPLI